MRCRECSCSNTGRGLNLIENLKIWLVVKPLQFLWPDGKIDSQLSEMRSMPEGSVGLDLARMLDEQGLRLVPGFFEHDLNHLVLGYGMSSEDELLMQAYLIGNRYYKWQCFIFLASAIIVPKLWPSLRKHFLAGRARHPVGSIDFNACLMENTVEIQCLFRSLADENSDSAFAV